MTSEAQVISQGAGWRDYLELCKPRVVALMLLTSIVGMCLATPGMVPWQALFLGNLGIALAAGAAACVNHLVDRHIDVLMRRTKQRPIVQGKVSVKAGIVFAATLTIAAMFILTVFVNGLTALLTALTIIAYAGIYSLYLKHATPQNIVIGGIAGAAPPMLGWVAVTGHIDAPSLLLMAIIFVWTPPHFWALAIARVEDYAKASVPMLPNTHGIPYTKWNVFLYTLLLTAVTVMPFAIGMSGLLYLASVLVLDGIFIFWALRLLMSDRPDIPMKTFRYSILYLMLLFAALLLDHYLLVVH